MKEKIRKCYVCGTTIVKTNFGGEFKEGIALCDVCHANHTEGEL